MPQREPALGAQQFLIAPGVCATAPPAYPQWKRAFNLQERCVSQVYRNYLADESSHLPWQAIKESLGRPQASLYRAAARCSHTTKLAPREQGLQSAFISVLKHQRLPKLNTLP